MLLSNTRQNRALRMNAAGQWQPDSKNFQRVTLEELRSEERYGFDRNTRDYRETIIKRVAADPEFAKAFLDEAVALFLNGEPEIAKLILRDSGISNTQKENKSRFSCASFSIA